ncbi:MAG: hypothetical protein RML56_10565 [Burkholderiales bacterium]|nr:hypothetical protein [Burkholderiales bacterium]
MRRALAGAALAVAGCASGPPPADWQLEARAALAAFERHFLAGDTRLAEIEFARLRAAIAKTGRIDLAARAELARCAVRTASLDFDDCPGFERLRADAGAEELAYADYLAGRRERAAADEPLSRLVRAAVRLRAGRIAPPEIAEAIEIASAQGWRRPLVAWLEVEARRAEAAGERERAAQTRRRIGFVLGGEGGARGSGP